MDYISHHGVEGQQWGVRNGPPYPLDKANKIFISGSSKTQTHGSEYRRKSLPQEIKTEIDSYISNNKTIIVGDAPGIDSQVQNYLKAKKYKNVMVFGPSTGPRYVANKAWQKSSVSLGSSEIGSKEWLAEKDIMMCKIADGGLAVILDEGSRATRKNIDRMIEMSKPVKVYELSKMGKKFDRFIN